MNVIRLAGIVTLAGLAVLIVILRRRDLRSRQRKEGRIASSFGLLPILALIPLFPEQASSFAEGVDSLYFFLVAVSLFFSLLVTSLIFYFAIKYRRRSDMEYGERIHGSLKLELVWTIVPFIISMIIFVWGARVYFAITRAPSEALEISGIGKQWMWRFQHPDGQREINELHVPVGRNVKLTIVTEDVIHSFFVPAFRVKADVVPGRITNTWFKATKPGRYHLFCAEYCGTQHSGMIGWVVVMEPSEYQAWLAGSAQQPTFASAGERLFNQLACSNCHRSDGRGRGPSLNGLFGQTVTLANGRTVTVDEAYIRESIFSPQAKVVAGYEPIMPTFTGLITEEQLLQLIAYIKSLGAGESSRSATPGSATPGSTTPGSRTR
jgi:cytochrome c oxidase subunit 2